MHHLRDYQQRALAEWERNARVPTLIVAPTGAGKGTMAAHLLAVAVRKKQRALFLVHRRELVRDMEARLFREGIRVSFGRYAPGRARLLSVQTALYDEDIEPPDLLIVDEAHHYAADVWHQVVERLNPKRLVGFTATPQRADGRPLGDMFEVLIEAVPYSALLKRRLLVPCRVLRPSYRLGAQQIAKDPVDAYLRYGNRERALIYVARIEEAERVAAELRHAGIRAAHLGVRTPKIERDNIMHMLEHGELDAVANVAILTEGIDVPHVSCIVLARPCLHSSTYLQIVGRGLRPAEGKEHATLIDLVGASYEHGLPHADRYYDLSGSGIRLSDESNGKPQRAGERESYEWMPEMLDVELVEVEPVVSRLAPVPSKGIRGGFLIQYEGRWSLVYRDGPKRHTVGLSTTDEAKAQAYLAYFKNAGPEKLRERVRFDRRDLVSLHKARNSSGSVTYSIETWNADRSRRIRIGLGTDNQKLAEALAELYRTDRTAFEDRVRQLKEERLEEARKAAVRSRTRSGSVAKNGKNYRITYYDRSGGKRSLALFTESRELAYEYLKLFKSEGERAVRAAVEVERKKAIRPSLFFERCSRTWILQSSRKDREKARDRIRLLGASSAQARELYKTWCEGNQEAFWRDLEVIRKERKRENARATAQRNRARQRNGPQPEGPGSACR